MDGISRKTFDRMDDESKLGTLFDYLQAVHASQETVERHQARIGQACAMRQDSCGRRFDRLDAALGRKRRWDTAVSGVTGLVGGFVAILTKPLVISGP